MRKGEFKGGQKYEWVFSFILISIPNVSSQTPSAFSVVVFIVKQDVTVLKRKHIFYKNE